MIPRNLYIRKQTFFALLAVPVCLILAAINLFRDPSWSYDVIAYQVSYENIINAQLVTLKDFVQLSFEPAFVLASVVSGYFTQSVNVVLFALSLVSLLIKLVFIPARYVKNNFVLLLVYVFTYYILLEITQNRVAIASAVILLGYHFLVTGRRALFVITVFFATCFHYSAVLALFALLFDNQNDRCLIGRQFILLLILLLLSMAFHSPIVFSIIEQIDPKKASYLFSAGTDKGSGFIRTSFVFLYQALILLVCRPSLMKLATPSVARFHRLLFHLYFASLSIYLAFHSFGVVAVRLSEVFRNLEPFLLVVTLSSCLGLRRQILIVVILVSVFVNLHKNNHIIYPLNVAFRSVGLTDKSF